MRMTIWELYYIPHSLASHLENNSLNEVWKDLKEKIII